MFQDINYSEIFKKAWNITWKNKILWWLGFFIAFGSGFGSFNFLNNDNPREIPKEKIVEFLGNHWIAITAACLIFLLIILIFTVFGTIANAGLIKSIEGIQKGEEAKFKKSMKTGKKYFWKLFFLNLILNFSILIVLFILAVPLVFTFMNKLFATGILLSVIAFLIFMPILIMVSFLRKFSYLYIVLSKISIWNALENSYSLFTKKITSCIIMGLIFIGIDAILGIGIMASLIPIAISLILAGIPFYFIFGEMGIWVILVIGFISFFLVATFIRSIFEVFSQASWQLFFYEIASSKKDEKIEEAASEPKTSTEPDISSIG